MRYICLVYLVEKEMDAMTKTQADTCTEESLAYDAALRKTGHLIAAHALQPVAAATTIRVRNGKLSTTDGPFAETKEQLAGFYLVDCKDLDEAIEWAAKIPGSEMGSVEVRPIIDYEARDAARQAATASA